MKHIKAAIKAMKAAVPMKAMKAADPMKISLKLNKRQKVQYQY